MTLPPATMYRWSASVSAPSGRSSPPRSVRARPGRLRALSVSAKIYMDLRAWSTLYGVFDGCAGRSTVLFGGFRPGQSLSWSKRASFKIDGWCEARRSRSKQVCHKRFAQASTFMCRLKIPLYTLYQSSHPAEFLL
jgi:hypothetical protein